MKASWNAFPKKTDVMVRMTVLIFLMKNNVVSKYPYTFTLGRSSDTVRIGIKLSLDRSLDRSLDSRHVVIST